MKNYTSFFKNTTTELSKFELLPLGALPSNAHELVIAAVEKIPKGYVATYAQMAYRAGLTRRRARFVGSVMRNLPENSKTPWHRVVPSSRTLANHPGKERQVIRLKKEGIVFEKNLIPYIFFKWPEY